MKKIPLTQGKFALVDDEDYEWLSAFKWRVAKGTRTLYASRSKTQKQIYMHRQILGLNNSKIIADHRDHNGLNNQKSNLRVCTHLENNRNRYSKSGSTSRFVGVCWLKNDRKWRAYIQVNGKPVPIGRFILEIDAAKARDDAVRRYYGDTAYLNLP